MGISEKIESIGTPAKRQPEVLVLAMLLFLLATGGFYGAYMLLADISGAKLGTPISLLDHLPIHTFLVPGIILLIFMGVIPAITTLGVLRVELFHAFQRFSLLKRYSWAYCSSVFTGFFLTGWTIGEIILWGANSLSVIYMLWGILILLVCVIPKTRKHFAII